MAQDKALDAKRIVNALDPDRLTKEDFAKFVSALADAVEQVRSELADHAKQLADAVDAAKQALEAASNDTRSTLTTETHTTLSSAVSALQERIAEWDARIASVKDGETPDIEEVAKAAAGLIQLPEYRAPLMDGPEEIRNKLETYAEADDEDERLDPRIIRGFSQLLKDIEDLKRRPVAFAGAANPYQPTTLLDASGTIDNSNTTFSFAQKPKIVFVNGVGYREGKGWAWTNQQCVLDNPVGTDGDIYGQI